MYTVMALAYIVGSICVGIPMAFMSARVWREGKHLHRIEGQNAGYTGGFWGFVLFPKNAFCESVGQLASEPRGIRIIGLGSRRGYRNYFLVTMALWLPRILFNILSLIALTVVGFFLTTLDRTCPRCEEAVTTFVRTYITRVDRHKRL